MKFKLLLSLIFVTQICSAQIRFQKSYGDTNSIYTSKIIQTQDGGYVITGNIQPTSMHANMLIIRLNQSGDTLWTRILDDSLDNQILDIIQTPDAGFALLGQSVSFTPGIDEFILIKLDSTGNLLWSNHYGGIDHDGGVKILLIQNNGFLLIGNTNTFAAVGQNLYLIETDSMGNFLQGKSYHFSPSNLTGRTGCNSHDNGYVIGAQASITFNNLGIYLCKIDTSGNILWSNTYGEAGHDMIQGMTATPDSGYIICGSTLSFNDTINGDIYVFKIDSSGNVLWSKTYGNTDIERANSIENTNDNGFIISGFLYGGNAALGLKLDSDGNVLWCKRYGNSQPQSFSDGKQTLDSGFVFVGTTYDPYPMKGYVVRTLPTGESGCDESNYTFNTLNVNTIVTPVVTSTLTGGSQLPAPFAIQSGLGLHTICLINGEDELSNLTSADITIYPNPFVSEIAIRLKRENLNIGSITVKNILGQIVFSEPENKFNNAFTKSIDLNFLPGGIYFLDAEVDGIHIVKKIVKQ